MWDVTCSDTTQAVKEKDHTLLVSKSVGNKNRVTVFVKLKPDVTTKSQRIRLNVPSFSVLHRFEVAGWIVTWWLHDFREIRRLDQEHQNTFLHIFLQLHIVFTQFLDVEQTKRITGRTWNGCLQNQIIEHRLSLTL